MKLSTKFAKFPNECENFIDHKTYSTINYKSF